MTDYMQYTKGGDVLVAPSLDYLPQYMLKCCLCEEYFSELQQFVYHYMAHNQPMYVVKIPHPEENESYDMPAEIGSIKKEAVHENINIKCERVDYEEDPNEIECDNSLVKLEHNLGEEEENPSITNDEIVIKEEHTLQYPDECMDVTDAESSNESYTNDQDDINYEDVESDDENTESKPSKFSICVQNFMKSIVNPLTLIEAYKNQPLLWNYNFTPYIRGKERLKSLQHIVTVLKEKLNIELTCHEVSCILIHLRRKYRGKLRMEEELGEESTKAHNISNFLDHLEFLKPFMQTDKRSIAVLSTDMPNLTSDQIVQILKTYRSFPHLWDTNLIEKFCKNKRLEALDQMLTTVNTDMQLGINRNTLENYLCIIHAYFSREKRCEMGIIKRTENRSEYYDLMMFLYDHVSPFKCSECPRLLRNPLYFKEHLIKHDATIRFQCSQCKKLFKSAEFYREHAKRHMDDLVIGCEECGKKFARISQLTNHMRCHIDDKGFTCDVCGDSFRYQKTYAIHKRRHNKEYLHHCPTCSKGFYTKHDMNVHVAKHKNEREFACKICDKAFKTKSALRNHKWTHEDGCFPCDLCGKTFKNEKRVQLHKKRFHKCNQIEKK